MAEDAVRAELWVNGGTSGGQGVRLAFFNGSQPLGSVRLDSVLGHPILAGTWQQVIVPLSAVGLSTGTVRDIYRTCPRCDALTC